MHNPFLLHPQQLRQLWKDLRKTLIISDDLDKQLQAVSDFWNQSPISKPYLDYLAPRSWPDAWTLLDTKLLDKNSLSLGMFYTLLLCEHGQFGLDRLLLAMMRQPSQAWEGLVCVVDSRWILGYDMDMVCDLDAIPDMHVMHIYKYDLQKRCIKEIPTHSSQLQTA